MTSPASAGSAGEDMDGGLLGTTRNVHHRRRSSVARQQSESISIFIEPPTPASSIGSLADLSAPGFRSSGRRIMDRIAVSRRGVTGRGVGHSYRRLWVVVLCAGAGLLLVRALLGVTRRPAPPSEKSGVMAPGLVAAEAARSSEVLGEEEVLLAAAQDEHPLEPVRDIDCDETPCRFVVGGRIGEQETKAQIHLYQLGLLASVLNRTLVLPNVDSSRLGSCRKRPFSFYYSEDALSRLGIKTVTQEQFLSWTERKEKRATAQVVSLLKSNGHSPLVEINTSINTFVPPPAVCADKMRLDFTNHYPVDFNAPRNYATQRSDDQSAFIEAIVNSLRSNIGVRGTRLKGSPEVLIFDHDVLRYPFLLPDTHIAHMASLTETPLPKYFEHYPYAETWTTLADLMVSSNSPMIAVHWRTETLPAEILAPCGTELVKTLRTLKKKHPTLRNVWMSTDYPLDQLEKAALADADVLKEPLTAHSTTYTKLLTPEHHAAMAAFLAKFDSADMGLRLTSFAAEEQLIQLPPSVVALLPPDGGGLKAVDRRLRSLDSAPVGIVDKLVSAQAAIFLAGTAGYKSGVLVPGACGKLSSFTDQIIGAREEAWKEIRSHEGRGGTLWNTVSRWSNPRGGRGREGTV